MHKTELIERMAERFPYLSFKEAADAINLIIDELIVALATDDRVSFQRFGSFETREVPKRTRTNPRNGDPVEVPAKRVVKFNAGKELRERCGLSEYLREREGSWGNKENVGVDVLEKYSNHPDRHVIGAILENKKCTPELVARIAGRMASSPDPVDRLTVASSGESCPPELIRQFCSDKDESVRAKAAEHCSAEMFDVLTRDKSDEVRIKLVTRRDLTESAAATLARDKSFEVRRVLAINFRKPSILSILARDPEINIRWAVLRPRGECPAEVLDLMADDESEKIRIAVAKKGNCMPATYEKLAADTDVEVRAELAQNSDCPESVVIRLAKDPDRRVRECLGRFGASGIFASLDPSLMHDLARDVEPEVRRTIGRRKDCPVELLHTLAIDSNLDVRCGVAANESCPADLLRTLASDPDPWVRKLVGGNAGCPSDLLAMLATDESDDVREAVADNKNCPDALLERLRNDKAPSVFGAALRTIHSR
jgi:nucleoid DNA-binding protein